MYVCMMYQTKQLQAMNEQIALQQQQQLDLQDSENENLEQLTCLLATETIPPYDDDDDEDNVNTADDNDYDDDRGNNISCTNVDDDMYMYIMVKIDRQSYCVERVIMCTTTIYHFE